MPCDKTAEDGQTRRQGAWRFQHYSLAKIREKDECSDASDAVSSESSIEGSNLVTVNQNIFNITEPQFGPGACFDFEKFLEASYKYAF